MIDKKLMRLAMKDGIAVTFIAYDLDIAARTIVSPLDPGRRYTLECARLGDDTMARIAASDIVLTTSNVCMTEAFLEVMARQPLRLTGVWIWDNHHMAEFSERVAAVFDLAFPAHPHMLTRLFKANPRTIGYLPVGSHQWGGKPTMGALVRDHAFTTPRSDALYGAFRHYEGALRNPLLEAVAARLDGHAIRNTPGRNAYDDKGRADQYAEWCGYKVSIAAPVYYDIPLRIFDALAAGQIPIVGRDAFGVQNAFTTLEIAEYPILFYDPTDPEDVIRTYRAALRIFDQQGEAGIRRRTSGALEGHLLEHRLTHMVTLVDQMVAASGI